MLRFSKKHSYPGILICVEGIDGSGKSTQMDLLYSWLKNKNIDVISTQWNSSDLISSTTKKAKKKNLLSGRTFSLLHAVDFADRLEKTIKPALKAGFVVLADRYVYTAFARDVARNVDSKWVRNMYGFAIKPDITFYFDVSPKVSLERICANRQPSFYEAGMDMKFSNNPYKSYVIFQNRIVEEYNSMVDEYGLIKVDAMASIHEKQNFIREKVVEILKKNKINIEG
ncbi:MAG: dTMP kinase [Candidatus Gastranaerophilales bacterium]|nr:dTMP kinase [Candidatus Gastranaerophilales bacterium]